MIRSAILRLTLAYLAIFMSLSIGFSAVLYHLSSNELNRGLRRPPSGVIFRGPDGSFNFEQFREDRVDEGQHRLMSNLILLNILMFAIGAGASYYLALRNLQPIEEAMEMESRFTADASHELRTPLTAMQTEIEVALRDPNLSKAEAKELLESNLEEVGKLRALAEGLLTLARGDTNNEEFRKLPIADVVSKASATVLPAAKKKNIKLTTTLKDGFVEGDEHSLRELFIILLDNAVKYSDPKTTVTVSGENTGKNYLVTIADQGYGIAEQDLPHIFERFYRSDTSRSKEKVNGYGLGLSIAKHVVEQHKGHITVSSAVGSGTTFSVELPALS